MNNTTTNTTKKVGSMSKYISYEYLQRLNTYLIPIIFVLVIPWGIWATNSITNNNKEIAVIQSNRFTKFDGKSVEIKIENIDTRLKVLEGKKVPPDWFKSQVDKIETNQGEIQKNQNTMSADIRIIKEYVLNNKSNK